MAGWRKQGAALFLGAVMWVLFTWPLVQQVGRAIPWTGNRAGGAVVQELVPGDHLQLLYHFWLLRDMLAGQTPWFANVYEFNLGDDAVRVAPGSYYAPFALIYAALAGVGGDALGWNGAGLMAVLLAAWGLVALARRHVESERLALAAAAVALATPYAWTTLLGGSPTGFGMALVPWLAWGLDVAVRDGRVRGGTVAAGALVAAAGTDLHTFYFSVLATPVLAIVAASWGGPSGGCLPRWPQLLRALWPVALSGLLIAAFALGTHQQLADSAIAGGRTWAEMKLFSPAGKGFIWAHAPGMGRHLYLGVAWFVLVGLSGGAILREWRRQIAVSRRWPVLLLFALVGGVLLLAWGAHGPGDGWTLKLARKLLPRFVMIRQSVKVYCLLPTILVVLLARTLPAWRRWRRGRVLIALLTPATLLDSRRAFAPGLCRLPQQMPVYAAVAADAAAHGAAAHAVALPLWPGDSHESSRYEYAAMLSRVRLVNGYSPVIPPGYREAVAEPLAPLNQGELGPAEIQRLRELRVAYIIMHREAFAAARNVPDAATVLRRLQANPRLERLAQDEQQIAFALLPE